jgi:hypothetical protein
MLGWQSWRPHPFKNQQFIVMVWFIVCAYAGAALPEAGGIDSGAGPGISVLQRNHSDISDTLWGVQAQPPRRASPGCASVVLPVWKLNFLLCRKKFDTKYDASGGSAPAAMASPGCDCAELPVRNRREISWLGHTEASQCAPAPNGGRVGARGAIIP